MMPGTFDPSKMSCGEPVLYPLLIDMTVTAEREFLPAGRYPFTIYFSTVPAGTGQVELEINNQWVPLNLGETLDFGHFATALPVKIRNSSAAAPGSDPARFIIGGTPDTLVER